MFKLKPYRGHERDDLIFTIKRKVSLINQLNKIKEFKEVKIEELSEGDLVYHYGSVGRITRKRQPFKSGNYSGCAVEIECFNSNTFFLAGFSLVVHLT